MLENAQRDRFDITNHIIKNEREDLDRVPDVALELEARAAKFLSERVPDLIWIAADDICYARFTNQVSADEDLSDGVAPWRPRDPSARFGELPEPALLRLEVGRSRRAPTPNSPAGQSL